MKTLGAIIKVMTALATVAGAIYIIATYGDKIVTWAKRMMEKCPCSCSISFGEEAEADVPEEAPVAEETPAEEEPAAAPEAEESAPVADEADFEG